MSDASKKKWLIKDREGRVRGPFYTDDILSRISRGEFSGEEFISLYPSTNWIPISNDPQFYDRLLETLDSEGLKSIDSVGVNINIDQEIEDDFIESKPREEKVNRAERISQTKPPPSADDHTKFKKNKERVSKVSHKEEPIIELKKIKKVIKRAKAKKTRLPVFVLTVIFLAVVIFLFSDTTRLDDRIHLIAPRKNQPTISTEQVKAKVSLAVSAYVQDTFSGYMQAQAELAKVLEGDSKNAGAIALMCLSYLELWPYAYQDAEDLQTISHVTQMASKVDPAGVEAATRPDRSQHGRWL